MLVQLPGKEQKLLLINTALTYMPVKSSVSNEYLITQNSKDTNDSNTNRGIGVVHFFNYSDFLPEYILLIKNLQIVFHALFTSCFFLEMFFASHFYWLCVSQYSSPKQMKLERNEMANNLPMLGDVVKTKQKKKPRNN